MSTKQSRQGFGEKMKEVKEFAAAAFAFLLILASGCKHQESDADGIRAGITQHLDSLNTLNLSAMDMDVNDIAIQGHQARAQVTFRPKTGAPPGAGMQVAYQLEKRDTTWSRDDSFVDGTERCGVAARSSSHRRERSDKAEILNENVELGDKSAFRSRAIRLSIPAI